MLRQSPGHAPPANDSGPAGHHGSGTQRQAYNTAVSRHLMPATTIHGPRAGPRVLQAPPWQRNPLAGVECLRATMLLLRRFSGTSMRRSRGPFPPGRAMGPRPSLLRLRYNSGVAGVTRYALDEPGAQQLDCGFEARGPLCGIFRARITGPYLLTVAALDGRQFGLSVLIPVHHWRRCDQLPSWCLSCGSGTGSSPGCP